MAPLLSHFSPGPIRVLIVDDHPVVRHGLRLFLLAYDDLELVGEAADSQAAIALCTDLQPDLILMDLILPGKDGLATIAAIHRQCPHIQIVLLTGCREKSQIRAALGAGAVTYLPKSISAEQLAETIRTTYANRSSASPRASDSK